MKYITSVITTIPMYTIHLSIFILLSAARSKFSETPKVFNTSNIFLCALCFDHKQMMFDCFCFNSRNAKIGKCKYERSEPLEHVFVCVCVCSMCLLWCWWSWWWWVCLGHTSTTHLEPIPLSCHSSQDGASLPEDVLQHLVRGCNGSHHLRLRLFLSSSRVPATTTTTRCSPQKQFSSFPFLHLPRILTPYEALVGSAQVEVFLLILLHFPVKRQKKSICFVGLFL